MSGGYARTAEQKRGDFARAKEFEAIVASALPEYRIEETTSPDRLDFWVPGFYVEVKEKRQPIGDRWLHHVPHLPERDVFIIDELTIRRALRHWPEVYFVLRDLPAGRIFCASITELLCIEHARVMRVGKGKWLINLADLRQLPANWGELLVEFVQQDLISTPWKTSGCLGQIEPPQV